MTVMTNWIGNLSLRLLMIVVLMSSWGQAQPIAIEREQQHVHDTLRVISTDAVTQIARQLMAPCCWSETADVHQSPAAQEVRNQIRSALQRGYTKQQIIDGFVASYGERILAKPKARGFNLLVWVLPAVALAFGGFLIWRYLQRWTRVQPVEASPKPAINDDPYAQRLERELEAFDN